MIRISPTGLRNEHWRKKLLSVDRAQNRYAQLFMTRGVQTHQKGVDAMAYLIACPSQMSMDINPYGDCDLLKVIFASDLFFLKVDCYASDGSLNFGSDDPASDEKTTRIFTCMLASEY